MYNYNFLAKLSLLSIHFISMSSHNNNSSTVNFALSRTVSAVFSSGKHHHFTFYNQGFIQTSKVVLQNHHSLCQKSSSIMPNCP